MQSNSRIQQLTRGGFVVRRLMFVPPLVFLFVAYHAEASIDFQDRRSQAACETPETRALLAAQLEPDPRDNVWVLEVMDTIAGATCQALSPALYGNYLDRLELNKLVQEPIPTLKTVREAIAWENEVEFAGTDDRHNGVTRRMKKLRDRAFTKSLALRTWQPGDPELEWIRARANEYRPSVPGVWIDDIPSHTPALGLVMTNRTQQPVQVQWGDMALLFWARLTPDGPFDAMFNCLLNEPTKKRPVLEAKTPRT